LLVGLGNPGPEYHHTRHNIGFMVLDHLAGETPWESTRHGWRCEVKNRGRTYILLKPNTYMNLSGKAVAYHLQAEKLSPNKMVVVTDDLALPFGTLRLRAKGSDGGHNGLKDITAKLGHGKYPRLRFGIGDTFNTGQQVDYVLSPFSEAEKKGLETVIPQAAEALFTFGFAGIDTAMTRYNKACLPTESDQADSGKSED
jgi:peptidyl-tRNA hydrolase